MLDALRTAAGDVERLVLLGDVVELRHGRVEETLAVAAPVLGLLAAALPAAAEVVLVAGNHDHHFVDAWLSRRGTDGLELENDVDWREGEPLAALAAACGGRRVRSAYPGVWLRGDVYAHHGHFGDRHTTVPMIERLAAGAAARVVREDGGGPRSVADYERSLGPVYAFIHAVAQAGGSGAGASAGAWSVLTGGGDGPPSSGGLAGARAQLRRSALRAGFGGGVAVLNRLGLGPLRADLSGSALRRAGLAAQAEVARRLEIDAAHIVFGHTHRGGPLERDTRAEWRAGRAHLWNSGCWVDEGALLGAEPGRSPYRSGFAVRIGDSGPPEVVNLLD